MTWCWHASQMTLKWPFHDPQLTIKWPSPDPQTTTTETSKDVQISVKRPETDCQSPWSEPYVHRQDLYGIVIFSICTNDIGIHIQNLPANPKQVTWWAQKTSVIQQLLLNGSRSMPNVERLNTKTLSLSIPWPISRDTQSTALRFQTCSRRHGHTVD